MNNKYRKAIKMIEGVADWLNGTRYACSFGRDNERNVEAVTNYAISEGADRLNSIKVFIDTGIVPEWYEEEDDHEDLFDHDEDSNEIPY